MGDFQREGVQRIKNPEIDEEFYEEVDKEFDEEPSGSGLRMPAPLPTRTPITNSPPVVITDKNRFPRTEEISPPKKGFFSFLGIGGKKSRKSRKSKKSKKSKKSRKTRRRRRM
uniref:Uncharacterized protein n=1 Tax=viral metagenome TaxID=1070528 RepID=A0A6C0CW67_9ZZZZ